MNNFYPEWEKIGEKLEVEFNQIKNWLENEFSKIQTNRINPKLFFDIKVEAYNSQITLNELANIQLIDSRSILIKPYDHELTQKIAKSICFFNQSWNPQIIEHYIKIEFPALNNDARLKAVKEIKKITEVAKINFRNVRKNIINQIKNNKFQKNLEEVLLETLDENIKKLNTKFDDCSALKEKELINL